MSETENTVPALAAEPEMEAAQHLSLLNTLIGVIIRPRSTFERMRETRNGHWWLVLVLAFVALVLVTIATIPIKAEAAQAALEAQQEQLENLPPDQQAQVEQMQAVFSSQAVLGGIDVAMGTVGLLIAYGVRAGLLFLLGLVLGGRASFRQIWRMAVWTSLPDVVRNMVQAVVIFVTGGLPISGLSYMFTAAERSAASPVVMALLGQTDIYLIWGLVLIGIGMVATSKFSRAKGAAVAVIYWLLGMLWTGGVAAIGQMLSSAFGAA